MTWLIRWEETEISSDDFLIEDLEQIEKVTGQPWSILNPLRDIKVAKAFLAIALLRAGKTEPQIELALRVVSLRTLKSTFDYKPDDEAVGEVPTRGRKSRARTSPVSSHTGRDAGGSLAPPESSGSETS